MIYIYIYIKVCIYIYIHINIFSFFSTARSSHNSIGPTLKFRSAVTSLLILIWATRVASSLYLPHIFCAKNFADAFALALTLMCLPWLSFWWYGTALNFLFSKLVSPPSDPSSPDLWLCSEVVPLSFLCVAVS